MKEKTELEQQFGDTLHINVMFCVSFAEDPEAPGFGLLNTTRKVRFTFLYEFFIPLLTFSYFNHTAAAKAN